VGYRYAAKQCRKISMGFYKKYNPSDVISASFFEDLVLNNARLPLLAIFRLCQHV
jgi:hypothetical protein